MAEILQREAAVVEILQREAAVAREPQGEAAVTESVKISAYIHGVLILQYCHNFLSLGVL